MTTIYMTYHELHEWYERTLKKWAFVIIAVANGNNDKLLRYQQELGSLAVTLNQRLNTVSNPDKKQDLQIMLNNVWIIIDHINQDFAELTGQRGIPLPPAVSSAPFYPSSQLTGTTSLGIPLPRTSTITSTTPTAIPLPRTSGTASTTLASNPFSQSYNF